MLAAYWAERQPDEVAIVSEAGDRTFAEVDANANRLGAGAAGARRAGRRRRRAAVLEPARVRRDRRRGRAAPGCGSRRSTGTSPATRPATSSTTARRPRSSPTRASPTPRPARPSSRRACGASIAVGGAIDGFETWDDVLAAEDGGATSTIRRRRHDALHVGHDRPAEGCAPARPIRARDLDVAAAHAVRRRRARAPAAPARCTTPRRSRSRWSAPAAMGVPIVMMDGWSAEETLALIEQHGVTHTHMVPTMFHRLLSLPDDVKARVRHLVARSSSSTAPRRARST